MGASYQGEDLNIFDFNRFYGKQLMWISLSFLLGVIILILDSKLFTTLAYPIFALLMLLLISVFFIGTEVKGAKSWIDLGFFRLQPSEFTKFATGLALAKYLSGLHIRFQDLKTKLISLAIVLVPCVTIVIQEDTGTALVYLSMIFVLYREGLSGNFLLLGFVLALLSVLSFIVPSYSLEMVITLLATVIFALQLRKISNMLVIIFGMLTCFALIYFADFESAMYSYFCYGLILSSLIYTFTTKEDKRRTDKLLIIGATLVSIVFINSVNTVYNHMLPHQKLRLAREGFQDEDFWMEHRQNINLFQNKERILFSAQLVKNGVLSELF
jgi:rod shape determining protein RodA